MTQEIQLSHELTERLQPNPWNPNKITDPANEERLRESMRRLGVFKPIVVRTLSDGSLQILGGEHRWKMAQSMKLKTVPVVNLGEVDDRRAKEIGLVDNGRYGNDDMADLSKLLRELGNDVMTIMPFADIDLQAMAAASANIDFDDLDSIDSGRKEELTLPSVASSGQLMRFKVPVGDTAWVTKMIEQEMKSNGFKDEDALSNAGNALISLLNRLRSA